ncbi:MAG: hypothetical protein Q8S33_31815 [Myxococcales bacterium]|nr:hypothetical protein [Myxococcales bacterium]
MKTSAWLRALVLVLLCAGCASTPGSRSQTSDQERLLTVVRSEALRLLEARLHVHGHVGQVSEIDGDRTTNRFIVTFADVSDTVAEISVDARSGEVVSSSIGGSP